MIPISISIRRFDPDEIAFVIRLTEQANWGYEPSDIKRLIRLEPEGMLMAEDGDRPVGITTAVHFTRTGWIGNVVVDSAHRSRGIGSQLVREAIRFLTDQGAEVIHLTS